MYFLGLNALLTVDVRKPGALTLYIKGIRPLVLHASFEHVESRVYRTAPRVQFSGTLSTLTSKIPHAG